MPWFNLVVRVVAVLLSPPSSSLSLLLPPSSLLRPPFPSSSLPSSSSPTAHTKRIGIGFRLALFSARLLLQTWPDNPQLTQAVALEKARDIEKRVLEDITRGVIDIGTGEKRKGNVVRSI